MKSLLLVAAILFPLLSPAQNTRFVFEGGFLQTKVRAFDVYAIRGSSAISPYASASLLLNLQKRWSLQAGLRINPNDIFIKQDSDLITGSGTAATPLFIRLPIHALYTLGTAGSLSFQLFAGPYIGVGIGGKYRRYTRYGPLDEDRLDIEERPFNWNRPNGKSQRLDYGGEIGARMNFMQDRAFLNFQYSFSFADLAIEGVLANSSIRSVSLGLGYVITPAKKKPEVNKPDKELQSGLNY